MIQARVSEMGFSIPHLCVSGSRPTHARTGDLHRLGDALFRPGEVCEWVPYAGQVGEENSFPIADDVITLGKNTG